MAVKASGTTQRSASRSRILGPEMNPPNLRSVDDRLYLPSHSRPPMLVCTGWPPIQTRPDPASESRLGTLHPQASLCFHFLFLFLFSIPFFISLQLNCCSFLPNIIGSSAYILKHLKVTAAVIWCRINKVKILMASDCFKWMISKWNKQTQWRAVGMLRGPVSMLAEAS